MMLHSVGRCPTLFGTNHAPAKRGMKVPSPSIAEFISNFHIDFGGEGTCHRGAISVRNNIGWCLPDELLTLEQSFNDFTQVVASNVELVQLSVLVDDE